MMRTYSKSGRALAGIMAVIFLMTSLLTFSVSADMSVAETSTASVAVGETATINVAGAVGTEQTTVLVYLGTPEDENIIFIDQKAATDGTASFTFKIPTTAAAGTYTVLAGSYSSDIAGEGSLVVTAGTTDPVEPTLVSIAVAADAKTAYNVGDEFVAPTVTGTYDDESTKDVTADATFTGYDLSAEGTQTVTVAVGEVTTTYEITVSPAAPVANENVRNGNYAVEVTVGTSYNFRGSYKVNVEPNTDYILSGWSKGSGSVLIRPRQNDGWSNSDNLGDLSLASGSEWKQASKIITTKDETTSVVLSVVTNHYGGAGTKYVDDIFFAKASEPTVNLVANPGFEGDSGWSYAADFVKIESGVAMTNNLSIISVSNAKTAYTVGDAFVAPTVTATNFDGTTADVSTEATFSDNDLSTTGTKTVKVTYGNAVTYYKVVVEENTSEEPTLTAITVSDAKTAYNVGDEFVAPTVTGTYDDESTKDVTADATFTGYDLSAEGTQTVTVAVGDVTTTYEITVSPAAAVANENVRNGNYAVEVTVASAYKFYGDYKVNVEPNTDYILSGWSKGSGSVLIRPRQNDGWSNSDNLGDLSLAGGSEWKQASKIITTKDETTSVVLSFVTNYYGGTGTKYVDDIFFAKASEPTVNLITNPGFEGDSGWKYADGACERIESGVAMTNNLSIISVSNAKTAYTVGDAFVAPTVTATNFDGTTADVSTEATFSGNDLSTTGTKTVKVTYGNAVTYYKVVVEENTSEEPTLTAITVSDAKTAYNVGDEFVAPTVTGTYDDESTKDVTADATFTGYDLSTAGTQTVTVKVGEVTTTYEITVKEASEEKKVVSIAVSENAVVDYKVDDEFVTPEVTAKYDDGSTEVVTGAVFEGYDLSTAGTQTVTVTYGEVSTTYEITVTAKEEPPVQPDVEVLKSYLDLDFEDAAYAQKDDGTGTMVDDYWNMTTTNKATGNKVTVAFSGTNEGNRYQVYEADGNKYIATKGRKTQVAYEFYPEESVSDKENLVYVEAKIRRTSYNLDDPVSFVVTDDSNNVIFRLNYKQNVAPVLVADATYETVTYPVNGDWTYVRAIIDFNKSTFELYQGASLDAMTAMVDGTTSFGFASSSAANISKIGNISVGDKKGSLGFDDVKIYSVAGPEKVVESITVAADVKTAYYVGDEFVAPEVTAKYTDSYYADEVVTATFEGYDLSTAGTQTVTVTYGEVSTTYEITVTALAIETITVAEDTKVEYTVGDEFVAPVVTAKYNNGSTAEVEATFTGYDLSTAGTQTVTVKVGEVTTTYEITVKDAAPGYTAKVLTQDALDEEGKAYVTKFVLDEGNGTSIVKVGDAELTWSAERECYVGIIDAENYVAADDSLLNVSVTAAPVALETFTYGDNNGDGKINASDLAFYKNYLELDKALTVKLAADLNVDGRLDGSDLSILKDHLEKNEPALKENN